MLRKDRPQVAVVGAGYWGRNLVRDFYNLGAIRLLVDQSESALAEMDKAYPGLEMSRQYEDALQNPDVSGVVLALPASAHFEAAQQALLHNKHVFVEKPLALSVRQGRELCELADDRGLILMVDHLLQRHPAVEKLRELFDSDVFGRVYHIYSRRMNFGKIRREESVLWSLAPHDLAMILSFMGRMPVSVSARGTAVLGGGIEDFVEADLFFHGGVSAHLSVSWLNPVKEQKLVVMGEKKMAVFDDTLPSAEKLKLYSHSVRWNAQSLEACKEEAEAVPLPEAEPLKLQCKTFLEAMKTGREPLTSGRAALQVLELLEELSAAVKQEPRVQRVESAEEKPYYVHPSSIVEEDAQVGAGSKIWHFSHVLSGCKLGDNCTLGQNVVVGPNVKMGRGCKLQNNVSVYEGVELADYVFCGPSMVFTNVINPRANISRKHEFKKTKVGEGVTIGANATIVCGNDLGPWCFIGAGALVTKKVPAHALMLGLPTQQVGWVCRCASRLNAELKCPDCGEAYRESPEGLEKI